MKAIICGLSLQLGMAFYSFGGLAVSEEMPEEVGAPTDSVQLPSTVQIQRDPDLSSLSPSNSKYKVVCGVVSDTLSFQLPSVTVRDGERVTVSDKKEAEVTAAVLQDGDYQLPITRSIPEGSEFKFTVLAIDEHHALVDVAATLQSVDSGHSEKVQQSIRINTLKGRFLQSVRIGDQASASFGKKDEWTLTFQVQAAQNLGEAEAE